jgi:predicted anti-sigma-YlaC factor YlaD
MNCAAFHEIVEALARQDPIDVSLQGSALAHAESCPACRRELNQAQELTAVLRRLAHQNREVLAPPRIEENLLQAFDERESSRRAGKRALIVRHRWLAAAAASVAAIGIGLLSWGPSLDPPPVEQAATIRNNHEEVIASEFFPLQGEMEAPPEESSGVVRVAVPRATLLAFGLPMNPELAMEPLEAEILVGEDGAAQAIRFLHGRQ